jgi:N-acetylmuramoyl-L-alanine amidase
MMPYPSPNFGERRGGAFPSLVVIHYTAMASCAEARARLCDPQAEVSAHWLISEVGETEALVPETARAWHAGAGEWAGLLARWNIPPRRVIAHSDMAPARKRDPGPRFDWRRLALQRLSVWPAQDGNPTTPLGPSLTRIGYPGAPPEARLGAFRLHFRPWGHGPESWEDRALADALAHGRFI